jgi:FADH2 O2-dependent halogenase
VIDASGGNSSIAAKLGISNVGFECMPGSRAVYAHFQNVGHACAPEPGMPYPPEDAAVHHVFDGGWIWILRFNNGITSAGAAYTGPNRTWENILASLPSLKGQFTSATPATPFYQSGQLSFRRNLVRGEGFALLPSAAGFVDPLLSTGFALTLLGVLRLAEGAQDYEIQTFRELDAAADLVSALYAKMHSFKEFALLTKLYFAALSFTETCWRLGKPEMASGFLLTNDARFSESRQLICAAARSGRTISETAINAAIAPCDVAGLSHPQRQNWYPVDACDLIAARAKVGASIEDLKDLFRRVRIPWPMHRCASERPY